MTILEGHPAEDTIDLRRQRLPVDRITAEAARMRACAPRILLDLVAMPFYLVGMLAFWLLVGLLKAVFWMCAAVKVGYVQARENAAARGVTMPVWSVDRAEDGRGVGDL